MADAGRSGSSGPSPIVDPDQLTPLLWLAANYRDRLEDLSARPIAADKYDQIAQRARATHQIAKNAVLATLEEMSQVLEAQKNYFQMSAIKDNYYGDLYPLLKQNQEAFEKAKQAVERTLELDVSL
ncbi:P4 [Jujube mosaic-associated virus]|uniref:P4 n=1 Tax=Jujube mosaic-associated virus TaxID=2020956 RepID=A0A221C9G4_9VIRU|nr:P4 [Jujube mosaic-associated virus]ASL69991.1 P4 [Jujube mosaic-associated virus]QZW25210.1 hypothetical protein [Jujube mosaic-associated virus]